MKARARLRVSAASAAPIHAREHGARSVPLPHKGLLVGRYGARAAHVPVLVGPAVAQSLRRRGAMAASLDGVVFLPHERVGPNLVAHEVAHALQQAAGGADSFTALADTVSLLDRLAHAPVVPEGARAETEATAAEATAEPAPVVPQAVLPPGVVSLRRPDGVSSADVTPAPAPAPDPAQGSAATPAAPQPAATPPGQAPAAPGAAGPGTDQPGAGSDIAPTFTPPEFVEPTLDPAVAAQRAAEAAAAQQALAAADSPEAVMAAYASMQPSVQAQVQPDLGARLGQAAATSNEKMGEATPAITVESRGGDGPLPMPAPVAVPADAADIDLGDAGEPTVDVPEGPQQPLLQVDPAYGYQIERRFTESSTEERVEESIDDVSTSNPGIETQITDRAPVPLDGANDPHRLDEALTSQREQASAVRQQAAQAIVDGPGPEQVVPRALDASAPAPAVGPPQLDALQPAPETQQLQALALPDTVVASFDQASAAQMQASAANVQQQMQTAQADRDTAHDAAVQQAETDRQAAEQNADGSQRTAVAEQRQVIQDQRQHTVDEQNRQMADVNAQAAQARREKRKEAQDEAAAGQRQIDDQYNQAERDAESKVRQGEEDAERERQRKKKESEEASWWDRAVNFIKDAFNALVSAITHIFNAIRDAVTGLIELARKAVVGLINAISTALQAIVSALGTVLKGLVDGLLGEIFPELAKALDDAIDAAVDTVNHAIDKVATVLTDAVNAIAAALTAAVNKLLDVFQAALNTALAALEAAITGDWGAFLTKILDAVLSVLGIDPAAFHALIAQAADAIDIIVNDPGQFVSNMIDVVVGGVQLFADHFVDHLRRGIIGWLTGALGDIQIPNEWNLWTVLDLARQILGLTWDFVRERATRLIGAENVARIEMMASWIGTLITEGWQGLWNRIQQSLESLKDSVLSAIKNFVMEKVIMAAITWLASLFNPVGALVKLVMTIWNIYQFVSAQLQRLFGIAQAVVGAISNIAHGVLEPGKLAVENVLGNLVPVVIDLLMSLLGVTGVAARVREIIHDLRQSIADAVDAMLQRVLQTLGLGGQGAAVATAGGPIGHPVAVGDKTMTIERQGVAAVVTVSGPPQPAGQWIDAMAARAHQLDEHARPAAESHIVEARAALGRLQPVADRAANTAPGGAQPAPDVVPFEDQLGAALRQSFEAVHGVAGGGDVRTEAIAALRADFAQAHPANIAAVQARTSAIKSQFAPRGLTHLDVDGTTGGQVEIKAAASPPQSVTVRFNEVFSAASLQPDQALFTDIVSTFAGQGRGSETLAVVTVNGIALGGRRNAEEHAEQELIASAEWQQALARGDQIGTPDNKADLVLTVNRSPCKAICTGVLSNWLQANAARHPNIRFIIASTGRYSPAVTKEDMLEQLWTTLISLGYEPTVPFAVMANLPRARVEQLFREVMGPLMRETTLRHDEVTDQSDLSRLAGSGWQLRQLQVVASVTPARGALAAMLRTLGQHLGSALRVDV